MSDWGSKIRGQVESISHERERYPEASDQRYSLRFFELLSFGFMIAGFVGLILIFFTKLSLVQVTCLFIISHVVAPSSGDRFRATMKGISTDLGYIRANITITAKNVDDLVSLNQDTEEIL